MCGEGAYGRARLPEWALEAGLSSGKDCSWPHEKFLLGPTLDSCFCHVEFELRTVSMQVFSWLPGGIRRGNRSQCLGRNKTQLFSPFPCLPASYPLPGGLRQQVPGGRYTCHPRQLVPACWWTQSSVHLLTPRQACTAVSGPVMCGTSRQEPLMAGQILCRLAVLPPTSPPPCNLTATSN